MNHKQWLFTILSLSLMGGHVPDAEAQAQGTGTTSFSNQGTAGQRDYFPQGMVGEAYIESDFDSRSIIVVADEETNQHIKTIIQNLDRPVPQVLIKVVFVEVTHRLDSDIGTEFNLNYEGGDQQTGSVFGLDAQQFGGFYRILERDLQVTVNAIEEVGRLEVLSRPSILTRNNQEAQIIVGQEVPFVDTSTQTDSGQINTTIIYRPIGIILRVTPFITPDGLVEMLIRPEISSISEEVITISEQVDAPVFDTRSADTVVTTPNAQTVVIGGLMEDSVTETDRKIPLLGDIPVLGHLFKRKQKEKTKTELLIFLTPIVVRTPGSLPNLTNYENNRTKLIPEIFSNDQMDTYLDNVGNNVPFDIRDRQYDPQPAPRQPPLKQPMQQRNEDAKPERDAPLQSKEDEKESAKRDVKPMRFN